MQLKSLLILVIFLIVPNFALAEMMSVGFSGTDLRSEPNSMNSRVIAELAPLTPVNVMQKTADYCKAKDFQGRTGWVHRALLSDKATVVVTGDKANVRQGPGTNHAVAFQVSKGMPAKLIEKQEKWVHIETPEGKQGWIADFLVWGD